MAPIVKAKRAATWTGVFMATGIRGADKSAPFDFMSQEWSCRTLLESEWPLLNRTPVGIYREREVAEF
jgi:hypothetical protein